LEDFLAPPLTVFFAGFLPAIFVICVYVSVFNNGVLLEGMVEKRVSKNFAQVFFWISDN